MRRRSEASAGSARSSPRRPSVSRTLSSSRSRFARTARIFGHHEHVLEEAVERAAPSSAAGFDRRREVAASSAARDLGVDALERRATSARPPRRAAPARAAPRPRPAFSGQPARAVYAVWIGLERARRAALASASASRATPPRSRTGGATRGAHVLDRRVERGLRSAPRRTRRPRPSISSRADRRGCPRSRAGRARSPRAAARTGRASRSAAGRARTRR